MRRWADSWPGLLFGWRRRFWQTSLIGNFYRKGFIKQDIRDMLANIIHIVFAISYISEQVLGNAMLVEILVKRANSGFHGRYVSEKFCGSRNI